MKSNFKNMKIAINEHQPLDEVVKELERLGFRFLSKFGFDGFKTIETNGKYYSIFSFDTAHCCGSLTTLTELKNMEV